MNRGSSQYNPSGPHNAARMSQVLSREIQRRVNQLTNSIESGDLPSKDEIEAVRSLKELESWLPRSPLNRSTRATAAILFFITLLFFVLAFVRVSTTEVQLDIRLTGLQLRLQADGKDVRITGEDGEIPVLKKAELLSVQSSTRSSVLASRLESLVIPSGAKTCPNNTNQSAFLTKLFGGSPLIPCKGSLIAIALAFDLIDAKDGTQSRGLSLKIAADRPAAVKLNWGNDATPLKWTGDKLYMRFYPSTEQKTLTVARNLLASDLKYDGDIVVLGGTIFVKNLPEQSLPLRPGDTLAIEPGEPAIVRHLSLSDGEVRAVVSYPSVKRILLGDSQPKNVMPTVFDWIRTNWPTQLYASITAIAAAWIGFKEWIKKTL